MTPNSLFSSAPCPPDPNASAASDSDMVLRDRMMKIRIYPSPDQIEKLDSALWVQYRFRQTLVAFLRQHRQRAQTWKEEHPEAYAVLQIERESRHQARSQAERLLREVLDHAQAHDLILPDEIQAAQAQSAKKLKKSKKSSTKPPTGSVTPLVGLSEQKQVQKKARTVQPSTTSAVGAKSGIDPHAEAWAGLSPEAGLQARLEAWREAWANAQAPVDEPWEMQDAIRLAQAFVTTELQNARTVMQAWFDAKALEKKAFSKKTKTPASPSNQPSWKPVVLHAQNTQEEVQRAWNRVGRAQRKAWEKDAYVYWLMVPRTILDQVMLDLEKSVKKAWADRKKGEKEPAGFPKAHKWRRAGSIRVQMTPERSQSYVEAWQANELVIPWLGRLAFRDSGRVLPPQAPGKLITIQRTNRFEYYASFPCTAQDLMEAKAIKALHQQEAREALLSEYQSHVSNGHQSLDQEAHPSTLAPKGDYHRLAHSLQQALMHAQALRTAPLPRDPETGLIRVGGADACLKDHVALSTGEVLPRQSFSPKHDPSIKHLQRHLSRKKKDSKRFKQISRKIARKHAELTRQRDEYLRLRAQGLAETFAILAIEDLFLPSLMRKEKGLGASWSDAAFGKFYRHLEREFTQRGHLLLLCPRFAKTSQICPSCLQVNPALKGFQGLKIRQWTCRSCGAAHHRDVAAAHNIWREALEAFLAPLPETLQAQFRVFLASSSKEWEASVCSSPERGDVKSPKREEFETIPLAWRDFFARGGVSESVKAPWALQSGASGNRVPIRLALPGAQISLPSTRDGTEEKAGRGGL